MDVAGFHADYDRTHPDDRLRLFAAIAAAFPAIGRVLYPGSYVDIAPAVCFDSVTFVDIDKRANRFFSCHDDVVALIESKRRASGQLKRPVQIEFLHRDYREPLPLDPGGFDLLVSLYAGFVSEHCLDHLAVGGHLLANPSHGDVAMASLDERCELAAVVIASNGSYRVTDAALDGYLQPKRDVPITASALHESGRGVAYTRSAFAYLFRRVT